DLVFPHHQNEVAQSEAATGKKFVNYWVHNEWLLVEGKKMSKSLGNFFTLRDLMKKGHKPITIRYLLMSAPYRTQLNFTEEGVTAAESALQRLSDFMQKISELKNLDKSENNKMKTIIGKAKERFEKAMDNNLSTSDALAGIFEFVKEINKLIAEDKVGKKNAKEIEEFMLSINKVLVILEENKEDIPEYIRQLAEERQEARKRKDFKQSDLIRDMLKEKGYIVEDTPNGPRVKKI
ncbi:MAG: class I tRNA ligase family protein, partial [Candidatus Woesearchaeota archaeon]|nr:class I tRNA ligase family protein [Candidatus Woesearchaeota archaeon]